MAKIKENEEMDATIKRLKNANKGSKIYTITVPLNDEGTENAIGYIRNPTRGELAPIIKQMEVNPLLAMELLLNTVWLEGDERIKTDDDVFFGAVTTLQDLIKFRVGSLKKN